LSNISCLQLCQTFYRGQLCYKIVFRSVDVNFSDCFEFSRVTNTRGHAYKLYNRIAITAPIVDSLLKE